jgi:hypothetical protein
VSFQECNLRSQRAKLIVPFLDNSTHIYRMALSSRRKLEDHSQRLATRLVYGLAQGKTYGKGQNLARLEV